MQVNVENAVRFEGVDYPASKHTVDDALGLRMVTSGVAKRVTPLPRDGAAKVLVGGGLSEILGPSGEVLVKNVFNRILLLMGDSREARSGNAYNALGGFGKNVTSITNNGDGTLGLTFDSDHSIPAGMPGRFSSDAIIDTKLRNRWFNFTSTGARSGNISVPADAFDYAYLSAAVAAAVNWVGTAVFSIDRTIGQAGSWSRTLFELEQPFDEIINLCVPGSTSADMLALVKTLDFSKVSHVGFCTGINDMAAGIAPEFTLANITEAATHVVNAGPTVSIDEEHSQGTMTSTKQMFLSVLNTGLHAYADKQSKAVVVPIYAIINDPATNTADTIDAPDGTHRGGIAQYKIGRSRTKVLRPLLKRQSYAAYPQTFKNALANPYLTGVAGTISANAPAVITGAVASNWTVARSEANANLTVQTRKVARRPKMWRAATAFAAGDTVIPPVKSGNYFAVITAGVSAAANAVPDFKSATRWSTFVDGTITYLVIPEIPVENARGYWQLVEALSGAAQTAQERVVISQSVTLAAAGFVVGDYVRGRLRVMTADSVHRSLMLSVRSSLLPGNVFASTSDGGKNTFLDVNSLDTDLSVGVMKTAWWQIPAGTVDLTFALEGNLGDTATNVAMRFFATEAVLEKRQ